MVFVAFSMFHQIKLNWTGPVWLAVVPAIASEIVRPAGTASAFAARIQRAWAPSMTALLLLYGCVLNVMTGTLPGASEVRLTDLRVWPGAWKLISIATDHVEDRVQHDTGVRPLTVGMDKYFLSSELAFYDQDNKGANSVGGRSLFGEDSLMYDYWFTSSAVTNHNMVLVALLSSQLSDGKLSARFGALGPVEEESLYLGTDKIGSFFYRVGYQYNADAAAVSSPLALDAASSQ
jgi:dolichol-phosphate mannosyltransferase